MKSFYTPVGQADGDNHLGSFAEPYIHACARVAVYDAPAAAPRVVDVGPAPVSVYIESLASSVYSLAREQGGDLPYSVVREVTENFIHADFADPVVSILDGGSTIRFADRGPGIIDKERALLPGFTTATAPMRAYIRGVGSGLPIVRDFLSFSGGSIAVDDNLGTGAVVTISSGRARLTQSGGDTAPQQPWQTSLASPSSPEPFSASGLSDSIAETAAPLLTTRQKQVLALVMESGSVGPSLVSKELKIGISTAYRDLASLEELGLIEADGGKRTLTHSGLKYLDNLITGLH